MLRWYMLKHVPTPKNMSCDINYKRIQFMEYVRSLSRRSIFAKAG